MMTVPLQVNAVQFDLFVILEIENIERIKQYDPAEIVGKNLGHPWKDLKIRNVMILFATAEETKRLSGCPSKEAVVTMLKELSRGWTYRPDKGDSDSSFQKPFQN
jgi:hypothetical protein